MWHMPVTNTPAQVPSTNPKKKLTQTAMLTSKPKSMKSSEN
jgi:hypothetical protein